MHPPVEEPPSKPHRLCSLNGKIITPTNSPITDWKTWDEWKALGWVPTKGSKATNHESKNLFHKSQITQLESKYDRYLFRIAD